MEIKRFIGGVLEANCYIITASSKINKNKSKQECLIIDPGYNPKKIIEYTKMQGLEVTGIVLTHHHGDHSGGAAQIRKELDCPLMIHTLDADMYGGTVDVYLENGQILTLEKADGQIDKNSSEEILVIHTPGHTAGSICLMSSKNQVCFTGDTIFNVDLGRTDLSDGSDLEMRESIRNIVSKWEDNMIIYPGHGDPASMKTVREINKEFLDIVNGDN